MRLLLLAILFNVIGVVSVSPVKAQPQQEVPSVFRGFVWGVSPDEVKKFEKATFYDDKKGLTFFEDTNVCRMIYRYEFNEGGLWRIYAGCMDFHRTTKRAALDVIADEKIKLEKTYGTPVRDGLVWLDSSYRNIAPWFERAFGMGKVRIETEWQTDETHILFQAFHNGMYYDLSYTLENRKVIENADQSFELLKFND